MAASAQLDARATAAGLLAASTARHEIWKAAEYQSALARAMAAKPAARRPAAASSARRVLLLLLLLLERPGAEEEKRAEPVPDGKEARPGEEEEEAAAAAATLLAVEVEKGDWRREGRIGDGATLGCTGALVPRFL